MNGRALGSAAELRARLALTAVGEDVELRVLRGGETRTIKVKIGAPQQISANEGQPVPQMPGVRVVAIERGSPLYQRVQGLIVAAVAEGSRAWQAGLRPADIIYAANGRRTRTLAELQSALRASDTGQTVNLLRGDFTLTIVMR